MAKFFRPISDISAGLLKSTGTSMYKCIDETVYDDSDYLYSTLNSEITLTGIMGLTALEGPYNNVKMRYRIKIPKITFTDFGVTARSIGTVKIELYCGDTLVTEKTHSPSILDPISNYATQEIELTSTEINKISDWKSLKIKITLTTRKTRGGDKEVGYVYAYGPAYFSWFEIEAIVLLGGLEMGCSF